MHTRVKWGKIIQYYPKPIISKTTINLVGIVIKQTDILKIIKFTEYIHQMDARIYSIECHLQM